MINQFGLIKNQINYKYFNFKYLDANLNIRILIRIVL